MKEDFQRFRALIARIGAGNCDAQWVERGVSAGGVGIGTNVDADFFLRPVCLVNVGEPLGKAHALFPDQWRDPRDPAAVGAVLIRPTSARGRSERRHRESAQFFRAEPASHRGFLLSGQLIAIFKIFDLVLQEDRGQC